MKNVMIVEDQKMIRSILEGYIDKSDDFVVKASIEGAEQAYEICATKTIHLILMDVQTAHRENGLAAVKKLKEFSGYPDCCGDFSCGCGILKQAKCSGRQSVV